MSGRVKKWTLDEIDEHQLDIDTTKAARRKVLIDTKVAIIKCELSLELSTDPLLTKYSKQRALLEQQLRVLNKHSKKSSLYYFVTICPPIDKSWELIKKTIQKGLGDENGMPKIYEGVAYSYEQRGEEEDEAGSGVHVHALIKKSGFKYDDRQFMDQIRGKFKNLFNNNGHKNNELLNIMPFNCRKSWEDHWNYIRGIKYDKEKESKLKIDKIWRKDMELEDYYVFGDISWQKNEEQEKLKKNKILKEKQHAVPQKGLRSSSQDWEASSVCSSLSEEEEDSDT